MLLAKAHIIDQLQKDLLKIAGFRPVAHDSNLPAGLEFLKEHLPQPGFPLGSVHEFLCNGKEEMAATDGFVSALLGTLMKNHGVTV